MQLTVSLNEAFHYCNLPMIIAGGIFALILLTLLALVFKAHAKTPGGVAFKILDINIPEAKEKYLTQMAMIEHQFNNGQINSRKAYQMLSVSIRAFVYEVTNIDMRKYVLSDFDKEGMRTKELYTLIVEYYEPEFSKHSGGDIVESIRKTKELVERWR